MSKISRSSAWQHKAFLSAFLLNLVVLSASVFVDDDKIIAKCFGFLSALLLATLYHLINIIDKRFDETFYLEKMNSSDPDDFSKLIEKSENIQLLGIHLNSLLTNYKVEFEQALKSKSKISFIIVPYNSNAIQMTACRYITSNLPVSVNKENARLKDSLSIIESWKKKYPSQISVKETDYLFEHELIILDKLIIDTRYNFGAESSGKKPKFFYKKQSSWFRFCQKEFDNHWDNAQNVTFTK